MRSIVNVGALLLLSSACGNSADQGGNGGNAGAGGSGDPVVCTSNVFWNDGDKGSELMRPGGECLQCHTLRMAPKMSVAGTVYPSYHEPDDCNGSNGTSGLTIVITDGAGKQLAPIAVNSVGNFHYDGALAFPYHVKVVSKDGKENAMTAAPETGDCNSCHSRDGASDAPGRIRAP